MRDRKTDRERKKLRERDRQTEKDGQTDRQRDRQRQSTINKLDIRSSSGVKIEFSADTALLCRILDY